MKGSGVYIIHTRKPHAPLGLPLIGRHIGYVGQTNSFDRRIRQHLYGGGQYMVKAKCWADLSPRVHYLHLPPWRWLMLAVELVLIWILCPVYNIQRQPVYNIRRIRAKTALRQRAMRDRAPLAWLLPLALRWAVLVPLGALIYWMVNR